MILIKRFLLVIACLLLACNVNGEEEESSAPTVVSSAPSEAIPSGVRIKVVDSLVEQVINDPVVHLKYWYWGGHNPDDLEDYIWMNYRETDWKVTRLEARVLKKRAVERLDTIYKKKAEIKFGSGSPNSVHKKKK